MKRFIYSILIIVSIIMISSCDHDELLTEEPKDFLSADNSFNSVEGLESGIANIYLRIREDLYSYTDSWQNFDMLGVNVDFAHCRTDNDTYTEYFYWNTMNADCEFAEKWWQRFYVWVQQANVIIEMANNEEIVWESEEQKNAIIGEAKFLRAFAYHFLTNMWGDVPLILDETTSPRFDYSRTSQQKIYEQCQSDLEFAIQWMYTVDEQKGGRAPRAAAYHLLTEVYICQDNYEAAINAASNVIDDPNFAIMTERFGVYQDFAFTGYDHQGEKMPWGDVYWDLFQIGNFNWLEGNTEAIWNVEFDVDILGGGNNSKWGGCFVLERWWTANYRIKDANGIANWLMDTLAGRPAGVLCPSEYTDTIIWSYKEDWNNDIRNSKYNIQREYYWTNPASAYYGQKFTPENVGDPSRFLARSFPSYKKAVPAVHYGLFTDANSGQPHDNGRIFKDWYVMRLAETYLLRAEAYLKNDQPDLAAQDINIIRNRANSTPVNSSEVTIDLILDERARELYMEEFRINTLMRMGKLVEYLMKYNPIVIEKGYNLPDYLNKLPIPQSEIEANKDNPLEQNTGYTN